MPVNKLKTKANPKVKSKKKKKIQIPKTKSAPQITFIGALEDAKVKDHNKGWSYSYPVWIPDDNVSEFKKSIAALDLDKAALSAAKKSLNEYEAEDGSTVYKTYVSYFVPLHGGKKLSVETHELADITVALNIKDSTNEAAPDGTKVCFMNLKSVDPVDVQEEEVEEEEEEEEDVEEEEVTDGSENEW